MKPGLILFNRISTYLLMVLAVAVIAACDSNIPDAPIVTVNVTVVENLDALEAAVTQAIGGTQNSSLAQTATVFAQGGVTLTPSPTHTASFTPTPLPTRFVTATRTPPPSETPTSTFEPFLTNTPVTSSQEDEVSWVRLLNAWQSVLGQQPSMPIDVYLNEERISRGLVLGGQTSYIQVNPGPVRLNLRTPGSDLLPTPAAPLISEVINIPAGAVIALVAVDLGDGLTLMPIEEDLSPISSGQSRLTIVQGNPELLPVNMLLSNIRRSLAENVTTGQIIGPMEIPNNSYNIDLFEVNNPGNTLQELPRLDLTARLNYILILSPFRGQGQEFTTSLLFPGTTRLLGTDVNARFINFAERGGPVTVSLDNEPMFVNLPVGAISVSIPVSGLGSSLRVESDDGIPLFSEIIGPWTEEESNSDKIFLLSDNTTTTGNALLVTSLSQNPPPTSINANLRLIHALPGGVPLGLEIRRLTSAGQSTENPWIPIAQVSLNTASSYIPRTPDVFDVRVVQAGTRTPLAQLPNVQMLAGGVYDFVVLPGSAVGSARLELIQPSVQITSIGGSEGDPEFIAEAVQATIDARFPQVTATPTGIGTATPTLTPVSTNTPRPTNTPSVAPPVLVVDPIPPNATTGVVTVIGENFAPGKSYSIRVDNIAADLANGVVANNGTIGAIITLPTNLSPGPHTIRVCVDCLGFNGLKQEQFAVVILSERNVTPTVTAQP